MTSPEPDGEQGCHQSLSWLFLTVVLTLTGCESSCWRQEKSSAWEALFDGTSTEAWRETFEDTFPEYGWEVANGELTVNPPSFDKSSGINSIVTKEMFRNFELSLEFKLTPGANSGIKYFVLEGGYGRGALGLEYQLLDDEHHKDGTSSKKTCGSLYDLLAAGNKKVNSPGQWNRARIVARGNRVEHWLNGRKVLEYDRSSREFGEWVAESKFKDLKDFGLAGEGHILLQDHHDTVSFRNIRIRRLCD